LRDRLADRPDLFEHAQKLQNVGQITPDRELWLGKILKRFVEMKVEAEQRELKDQIAGATEDQVNELLRKLQENHLKEKKTERAAKAPLLNPQ
jgi:hypothetical protein